MINNQHIISITNNALHAIMKLKHERQNQILLRIGVKQGGCSGMSYIMHIEYPQKITSHDKVINYSKFKVVCDYKSLLFLYGLSLDYSNNLVGGGFSFINPNATQVCGCGKSFTIDKV